jgi:hypothetical protein
MSYYNSANHCGPKRFKEYPEMEGHCQDRGLTPNINQEPRRKPMGFSSQPSYHSPSSSSIYPPNYNKVNGMNAPPPSSIYSSYNPPNLYHPSYNRPPSSSSSFTNRRQRTPTSPFIRTRDGIEGGESTIQEQPIEQPFIPEKLDEIKNKIEQLPERPPFNPPPKPHHAPPPPPPQPISHQSSHHHHQHTKQPVRMNDNLKTAYKFYRNEAITQDEFNSSLEFIMTNQLPPQEVKEEIKAQTGFNQNSELEKFKRNTVMLLDKLGDRGMHYVDILRRRYLGQSISEEEQDELFRLESESGIYIERGLGDFLSSSFKKIGEWIFGKPKQPTPQHTQQPTTNQPLQPQKDIPPEVPITKNNQGQWDIKALSAKFDYYNKYFNTPEGSKYQFTKEEEDAYNFIIQRKLYGANNKSGFLDISQENYVGNPYSNY